MKHLGRDGEEFLQGKKQGGMGGEIFEAMGGMGRNLCNSSRQDKEEETHHQGTTGSGREGK